MTRSQRNMYRVVTSLAGIAVAVMSSMSAHAESVMWSTTDIPTLHQMNDPNSGGRCLPVLGNVYASVQYNVRAVDAATGASICGASVPQGAQIRLEFVEHVPSDVYWVGTGYYWDSPYGDWVSDAALPPGPLCQSKNSYFANFYASLSVAPPTKTVTDIGGLSCGEPSTDGSIVCAAQDVGPVNPRFSFGATKAHYYWADGEEGGQCTLGHSSTYPGLYDAQNYGKEGGGTGWSSCGPSYSGAVPYTISVPVQSVSCPFTIVKPTGTPPAAPTVSATNVALSCGVGTPYNVTMGTTDPESDGVRYGVDWDADGSIDQFSPSTGYTPSGASQTVTRVYASAGSKEVRVKAFDTNALASPWSTFTFYCSPAEEGGGTGDGGEGNGGSGSGSSGAVATPTISFRTRPSLLPPGEQTHLEWEVANVDACSIVGTNGDVFNDVELPASETTTSPIVQRTTFTLSCDSSSGTITQSATVHIIPQWSEL